MKDRKYSNEDKSNNYFWLSDSEKNKQLNQI